MFDLEPSAAHIDPASISPGTLATTAEANQSLPAGASDDDFQPLAVRELLNGFDALRREGKRRDAADLITGTAATLGTVFNPSTLRGSSFALFGIQTSAASPIEAAAKWTFRARQRLAIGATA